MTAALFIGGALAVIVLAAWVVLRNPPPSRTEVQYLNDRSDA